MTRTPIRVRAMVFDVAIRRPRDDRRDPVLRTAHERDHRMLAVPHAGDERRFPVEPAVRLGRFDREAVRCAHQAQIVEGDEAEAFLNRWRPADAFE